MIPLILFISSLQAEPSPQLVDRLTLITCQFLEDIGSRTIPENKRKHISKTYLTTRYLRGVVRDCLEAASLNPSGGGLELAGIRLLSAAYGESAFYSGARFVNRNGSTDIGIMQVNSVHWFGKGQVPPTFRDFCDDQGLEYDTRLLYRTGINIKFAAVVNQMLYRQHCRTYRFNYWKRPDQRKYYKLLLEAIK